MKTYNKSQIMKLAHTYRKRSDITMSVALKLAWVEAKKNSFYWVLPKRVKRVSNNASRVYTEQMQESMIKYYSRGGSAYYGD